MTMKLEHCVFLLDPDDKQFAPIIETLARRRPKAVAFLRRIGCYGLAIQSVGTSMMTLVPMMEGGDPPRLLGRQEAKELGATEEELNEFSTIETEEDIAFTPKWQWGPPTFSFEKKNEAEALAAEAAAKEST